MLTVRLCSLLVFATAVTACGALDGESFNFGSDSSREVPDDSYGDDAAMGGGNADGGNAAAPPSVYSPLCGSVTVCNPDEPLREPSCASAQWTDAGAESDDDRENDDSSDAGITDATSPEADPLACRVANDASGTVASQCAPAGAATQGESCRLSTDCAAGLDCVADGTGDAAGHCQPYCCAGECSDPSTDGAATYCALTQTTQGQKIPACLPVVPCQLMLKAGCAEGLTCAVVREDDGTTGCVPVGSAQVGEACDTESCDAGLTCLGAAGSRRCFQLCSDTSLCPENQECTWAPPLFQAAGVGVCTAASSQRRY